MVAEQPAPLVVIEATGGLEQPAARLLSAAGIAVAVVNPRHTRQFAKGLGWLAKTDRLDALLLARYGALARPAAHPPPSVAQARLPAARAGADPAAGSRARVLPPADRAPSTPRR